MTIVNQIKLSIFIGIVSAIVLFLGGIFLPTLISSQLPLSFIISVAILYLLSFFAAMMGLIKLFKLKNILNNSKRKCHEKQRKTESTTKSELENSH